MSITIVAANFVNGNVSLGNSRFHVALNALLVRKEHTYQVRKDSGTTRMDCKT